MARKVVVTSLGAISGNGDNVQNIWNAILTNEARRNVVSAETHFDIGPLTKACTVRGRGLVNTVCASPHTNEAMAKMLGVPARRYERHQLFALLAAREAMTDIEVGTICDPERFAVIGGTGAGGLQESADAHKLLLDGKGIMPTSNLRLLPNIFIGYIANTFGLKGPTYVHCSACAASLHALMHAADMITANRADMALVVGADASITPFGFASFCAQGALSNESRPYQAERTGFLMGEGAAAIVIEEYTHAKRRGARILATIEGWASAADGTDGQITDPNPSGGARTARLALKMADVSPTELACIKTHGTGTPVGDGAELEGITHLAGEFSRRIPITATKSYSGHLLGAAGAFEAMLCVKMLATGTIPHTHGLTRENVDPKFADYAHVMRDPAPLTSGFVLANSFGFGGTNGSVVFGPV